MSVYREKAMEYFHQGFNCSQSVAAAFSDELGLPTETVLRLASGFGAGVGRMRLVCGAFSGMTLVLGMLYGSSDPAAKSETYAIIQEQAAKFQAQNTPPSLICAELLGLKKPEQDPHAAPRTAEYYKKRPCAELVGMAADLTAEYMAAHPRG